MNPTVSDTVRLARILCILMLVYAHAQPYQPELPETLLSPTGVIDSLRRLLGHTSVPLLSLISGYLLAHTLSRRPYLIELGNKFTSLIVPLVLWNLIYLGKESVESGFTPLPPLAEWPNDVLAITAPPAMMPLYFLRDAFVGFLMTPVMLRLARRLPRTTGFILFVNALFNLDGVLFLNSAIPLFLFAGYVMVVHRLPVPSHDMPVKPVVWAALVMLVLSVAPIYLPWESGVADPYHPIHAALDIALRAAGCVVFWFLAVRLLHRPLGKALMPYEPIAFFVFCAHGMAAGLGWVVIEALGYADAAPVYLSYFLLAPLLALGVCVLAVALVRWVAPVSLSLLMGGRVPSRQQMAHMFSPLQPRPLAPATRAQPTSES